MAELIARVGDPGWNPEVAGTKGRPQDDPGRSWLEAFFLWIAFRPNERQFRHYGTFDPLEKGVFGSSSSLRHVLTFGKIKGGLTKIFFSMEASNTDFHPHQFLP
jgi:hypothetical protein